MKYEHGMFLFHGYSGGAGCGASGFGLRAIFPHHRGAVSLDRRHALLNACLPAHYSITLVALINSDCGMVRPNALAVLRLINNSNVIGCSTGMSPGLAPLKILIIEVAPVDWTEFQV